MILPRQPGVPYADVSGRRHPPPFPRDRWQSGASLHGQPGRHTGPGDGRGRRGQRDDERQQQPGRFLPGFRRGRCNLARGPRSGSRTARRCIPSRDHRRPEHDGVDIPYVTLPRPSLSRRGRNRRDAHGSRRQRVALARAGQGPGPHDPLAPLQSRDLSYRTRRPGSDVVGADTASGAKLRQQSAGSINDVSHLVGMARMAGA